jgi:hypothetical protein
MFKMHIDARTDVIEFNALFVQRCHAGHWQEKGRQHELDLCTLNLFWGKK